MNSSTAGNQHPTAVDLNLEQGVIVMVVEIGDLTPFAADPHLEADQVLEIELVVRPLLFFDEELLADQLPGATFRIEIRKKNQSAALSPTLETVTKKRNRQ